MPAIASLEDLKSARKDLLEAKDLNELKAVFKKWRRIGGRTFVSFGLKRELRQELRCQVYTLHGLW